MKSGKILLGVLAGVAAGALMGILLAPGKGSKTRRKILSKGERYADTLQEKFDGLVDTISKKYEITKDETGNLIAKGKAKYDGVKAEIKNDLS